ncbi:MAG: hypothetical protein SF066_21905 [Thermoanaerobaculia bacterium]|nr:hypothetical protein [Thermoanaerobaculia bacterium]
MTSAHSGPVSVTHSRRFAELEAFHAAATAARLTPVGLVLPHLELGSPPVGTELAFDWRLADDTGLFVGRAEVVEVTGPRATLRMIELDPGCRVARLFAGSLDQRPEPARPPGRDPDDSVVRLVQRTYQTAPDAHPAVAAIPDVFVPPEPVPSPPARSAAPPEPIRPPAAPPAASADEQPLLIAAPRRRLWPVAAALAVALGLGLLARLAFPRIEPILAEMLSDAPAVDVTTLDVPPAGVQPSTLPPPVAPVVEPPQPVTETVPVEPAVEGASAPDPEPPAVAQRPLDRLRSIRWEREGDTTVVTLLGNGSAHEERLLHTRLDAPQPRELLKVRGVDLPFRQSAMDVGTPELQRIRVGFHPKPVANELHIVLDLPSHDIALTEFRAEGQVYRLVLSRRP